MILILTMAMMTKVGFVIINIKGRRKGFDSHLEHSFSEYFVSVWILIIESWLKLALSEKTKGSQTAHIALVKCHYFLVFTIPWDVLKKEYYLSIGRCDYCKHVHISVWLAATRCDGTYTSAQRTLYRRPTLIDCKG